MLQTFSYCLPFCTELDQFFLAWSGCNLPWTKWSLFTAHKLMWYNDLGLQSQVTRGKPVPICSGVSIWTSYWTGTWSYQGVLSPAQQRWKGRNPANAVVLSDTELLLFYVKLLWHLNAAGMFKLTLHTFRNNVLFGPEFSYPACHSEFCAMVCTNSRGHSSALQQRLLKSILTHVSTGLTFWKKGECNCWAHRLC